VHVAQDPFYVVETVCVAWFSVEFVMRLAASPSKRQFVLDVMNVFDMLAIVPYFVVLAVQQTEGNCEMAKRSGTFVIIRVLRVFRIFKLSKHSQVEIFPGSSRATEGPGKPLSWGPITTLFRGGAEID